MRLALKGEAIAVQQILRLDRLMVGQAELPERYFIGRRLTIVGVEIGDDENAIIFGRRQPRVDEHLRVGRYERQEAADVLQSRIGAPNFVQCAHMVLYVAGLVPVENLDLVFLRIEIFLTPRNGFGVAEFKAAVEPQTLDSVAASVARVICAGRPPVCR